MLAAARTVCFRAGLIKTIRCATKCDSDGQWEKRRKPARRSSDSVIFGVINRRNNGKQKQKTNVKQCPAPGKCFGRLPSTMDAWSLSFTVFSGRRRRAKVSTSVGIMHITPAAITTYTFPTERQLQPYLTSVPFVSFNCLT